MKFFILYMITFMALEVFSSSSIEKDKEKIESSYHPQIKYKTIETGFSFSYCQFQKIEITGKDPISFKERKININMYHSIRNVNKKAVIVLPPTGGVNVLDRGYANELCKNDITAAVISDWDYQNEMSLNFDMHNKGALRALAATRHAVELLNSLNYHSIGLLGTSIGAVTGTLAIGFETRISAVALIVGGASFADIVANSDEKGALKLRKERMNLYKLKNLSEYATAARANIWVNPAAYLNHLSADIEALIITADSDTTVLTKYQLDLLKIFTSPKQIPLSGGHRKAILDSFIYKRKEIVQFFRDSLK